MTRHLPVPKQNSETLFRDYAADRAAFRMSGFDALWRSIDAAGGAMTLVAGHKAGIPEDALICRTVNADGSITFERGPKR